MRFQLVLLSLVGLGCISALATPVSPLQVRQNDVPPCQDGGGDPVNEAYDTAADCQDHCFLKENADGDNKGGICKGLCINVGHPAPIFQCRSKGTID
ncbi:hypothetical protein ONS95_014163 [Cadophora gregata]|uniref:uncharacterized protein n=1 Tax=Cadophora gregata TaxID=51156 RepID=UPI0026DD73B6|nr:uncharacterized protein ONS95_014163 [Cadophora gregata]KAK0113922.1 hypothetical protein ONS96_014771 [Cadophora gregata f. sp. sojae]KAK0114678.1 hypothetical protein ONS95_014163 [Cadophora gregata]